MLKNANILTDDVQKSAMPRFVLRDVLLYLSLILLGALSTISISTSIESLQHRNREHGCEDLYWKPHCRLKRGKSGYRSFLAHAGLLLPPAIHQELSPSELLPGRLLIVGDVHGCIEELQELLKKVEFKEGRDNLFFVGDLGDKGPHSIEVINEIRRLGAHSVRGNHDDTALGAYEAIERGEKVKGKHKWAKHLSETNAAWLAQLPWSISIPALNIVIVHAGLVPEVALENQLLIDMYRMREVEPGADTKWHGVEAKVGRGKGKPWAQVWSGPQHVVFGHDRQKGLQEEAYATGIDTGCVYGKFLTGLLYPGIDSFPASSANANASSPAGLLQPQLVQVKAKKKYA